MLHPLVFLDEEFSMVSEVSNSRTDSKCTINESRSDSIISADTDMLWDAEPFSIFIPW